VRKAGSACLDVGRAVDRWVRAYVPGGWRGAWFVFAAGLALGWVLGGAVWGR